MDGKPMTLYLRFPCDLLCHHLRLATESLSRFFGQVCDGIGNYQILVRCLPTFSEKYEENYDFFLVSYIYLVHSTS